jgi:hypothetical protein
LFAAAAITGRHRDADRCDLPLCGRIVSVFSGALDDSDPQTQELPEPTPVVQAKPDDRHVPAGDVADALACNVAMSARPIPAFSAGHVD